jgi:hypothetical protein
MSHSETPKRQQVDYTDENGQTWPAIITKAEQVAPAPPDLRVERCYDVSLMVFFESACGARVHVPFSEIPDRCHWSWQT